MIEPLLAAALALSGGEADVRTVAVGIPVAAAAVLEEELRRRAPGVEWSLDHVPPDRLASVLVANEDRPIAAVVGYGLPLLSELAARGRLASAPECATGRTDLGGAEGALALWFDPLVIVWSDGGTGVETRPPWAPETLAALCEGGVDERLLISAAAPWNGTGALVTSLAEAGGGDAAADERLIGLDGNRAAPYAERPVSLLRRLAAVEPGEIAVTTRAALMRYRAAEPEAGLKLRSLAPRDRLAAVLLGAAALDTEAARPVFDALGDEAILVEVSRAAALLPTATTIAATLLPADAREFRVALAGESPRLAREQGLARTAVDRYVHELVGRHEGREALFSEVFDALGIVAMAAFVIWVLRRRDGASRYDQESAAAS